VEPHNPQYPYLVDAIGNPFGCGGSKRGGGTAGPRGDVESTRAGDDGEYHHSRNLMKNMAVGSRILSESRTIRGEVKRRRRSTDISLPAFSNGFALSVAAAASAAARFTIRISKNASLSELIYLPDPQRPSGEGQLPPMITKADKTGFFQTHTRHYTP
jgi:hypothetical protein